MKLSALPAIAELTIPPDGDRWSPGGVQFPGDATHATGAEPASTDPGATETGVTVGCSARPVGGSGGCEWLEPDAGRGRAGAGCGGAGAAPIVVSSSGSGGS